MSLRAARMRLVPAIVALFGAALATAASAAEPGEIVNYRQYSGNFASAGQPTREQLAAARHAGFERVVYLAYSDQENALPHEDRIVKNLGMEFVHIPVEWDAPTPSDFALVAAILESGAERKTLLHCAVNYRASAFSFLYRVIHEGVPVAEAKADLDAVWTPNETWRDLIFSVLDANGMSADCEGCDWTTGEE